MMKKLNYIIIALALVSLTTACSKKNKTREERIEEFRADLTKADTTSMLRLCDDAMEQLKNKQIDQVLASLYEYNDSTEEVKPLSEELGKRYAKRFKMFPVLDYKRLYYSFMLEGCNDVKYEVTFATAEQAGSDEPATTMYMFNPVKIDGDWKLCVKTPQDEHDEAYN
jgi:hypothetical protein